MDRTNPEDEHAAEALHPGMGGRHLGQPGLYSMPTSETVSNDRNAAVTEHDSLAVVG